MRPDSKSIADVGAAHDDADKKHLWGLPDDAELHYDDNGVIRLILIDPRFPRRR